MEWIVTTGRSIEEAKEAALDQLGVAEDEAEFEIEEEPKPGLFGRMRREARIRARVAPMQPRPKVERKRSDRGRRKGGNGDAKAGGSGGGRDRAGRSSRSSDTTTAAAVDRTADTAATESSSRSPRNDRPPREDRTRSKGAPVTTIDIPLPEHTDRTRAFIEGLVDAFGLEATVESAVLDDENSEIRVEGDELGILIGPKGQTLTAVQTLARAAVQRQREAHFEGRVHLDVSGYRQRRKEALEQFALRLAQEVADSGVEKALEPMGSADRKIVHDIVGTVDGVRTLSVGEDPRRRVVISPTGD